MPPVAFNTGGGVGTLKIVDLDGDGKPDLVMLNIVTQAVTVLRNTSTSGSIAASSFATKIDFPLPSRMGANTLAIGDIDGDGKIDVITSSTSAFDASFSVFRNTSTNGSITFAPGVDFHGRDSNAAGFILAIGDLDGDGKLDIAMGGGQLGGVSIWRNISTPGSITINSLEPRVDIGFGFHSNTGTGSQGIAIGDLDGDGKPEIVAGNFPDSTICVWHNISTPGSIDTNSFSPAVRFATAGGAEGVIIGDLDGDGKPDIVAASAAIWISVLRNTSTKGTISAGSFAPKVDFRTSGAYDYPVIGDLDGDGKPDILVDNPQLYPTSTSSLSIFRNTSTIGSITINSFAPRVIIPTDNWAPAPAIGDLDGDGKADIALAYSNTLSTGNSVVVFRNDPLFPPDIQATNLVFTNTAANSTTVSWTNGDGTERAVFISNTTTGSPLPVQSTTYTANAVYRSGSQIGASRWYCIYNGTGSTVNVTGLSSGATYRVMVVEYNGSSGAQDYLTTPATGNPANVTTLSGGPITINSITRVTDSLTNAGSVQYNVTFAAGVTGLNASNFALATTGNISGAAIASLTGSGSTYTVTVNTGTGDGNISLNLANAGRLTPGIVSPLPFVGQIYTIDRTPPSVTISAPSVNTMLSGSSQLTYTVTYADDNFKTSNLTASDITLNSNGSATGTVSVSASGTTYTVTISAITGSGTLGFSIAAGTAIDLVGNTAPAAGPSATCLVAPVLSDLTINSGTISPVFESFVMDYGAVVPNATSSIIVTPTTTDPNAKVTVNGGSASTPVNLAVGPNTIVINVTTLDGSATTAYTLDVLRNAPVVTGPPPNIAYGGGNIEISNASPFSILPTNTGGPVPQTNYGQVSIFAGSPSEQAGYIDQPGTAAQFNWPQQAVMDAASNLYVTDANNNAIRIISPTGVVNTFAGSVQGLAGSTDARGTAARFSYPDGIAIDGVGNLYVSDYSNNAIRKITPFGDVTTLYSSPSTFGPGGLCVDGSGNIIVAAQDASQIIKITPAGVASIIAGSTPGYTNGPALSAAQFNTPGDVKIDASGNLYVADFGNNAIRKITPGGQVSTIAGSDVAGNMAGFADGVGTAAIFNNPPGLYIGPGGVIYVADLYNNDIREIMPDGTVSLVAGSANQVPGDADGTGTAAGFNLPVNIYIDNGGTAYISELGGNRIRKMVLTGYTLKGKLPAGLVFDPTTGKISGSPTVPFTTTTDTVTAYNAFGYSTTVVTISYKAVSNIATLTNLQLNPGTLAPLFASGTFNYTAAEPNSTTSVTITPTVTDPTATITVNGRAVVSGTASSSIPLNVGPNIVTTVVTAQDGITKDTYTVTVTRAPSSDAFLSNLTISQGVLTPSFASGMFNYTAAEPNSITSVTITPTATDPTATITVNGSAVTSGTASSSIPLKVGPNTITTVVTAQDGTTKDTYTVIVTRAPSSDALLSNLTISEGALTPSFSSGVIAYADTVSGTVNGISLTPTADDANATITVNGVSVASGTASGFIPLTIGSNTIDVIVTAQDGITTKTYTVTIYKGEPPADMIANNVITPNGDGKNDYWVIKDIELYPQNNVVVFDKGGRTVFEKRGYRNEWDGTLNGAALAEGTYYFVVDLGPNLRKFKGYIAIVRN